MFRLALSDGRWLRLLEESDARELHAAIEANREHLAPWMPWAAGQTLASTVAFITRTRRQLRDNDGFQTVVVEDGQIVGVIGYHGISWRDRSTGLGYWLTESAQGRGTMTLAVRALMDHAFEHLASGSRRDSRGNRERTQPRDSAAPRIHPEGRVGRCRADRRALYRPGGVRHARLRLGGASPPLSALSASRRPGSGVAWRQLSAESAGARQLLELRTGTSLGTSSEALRDGTASELSPCVFACPERRAATSASGRSRSSLLLDASSLDSKHAARPGGCL